jgi:polysaccharide pyruvyl transferase WcaK-like protein
MQQSSWLYVPQQLRPAFLAKKCGVPTVLYCSGVEPISSSWLRGLVRKSCHDVFDALIVRGPRSKENLRHCGVTKEIVVSVDPAVSLRPAPSEEVRAYLLDKLGLDPARIFISLCPKVIRAYGGILPVSLRKKINFKRWIVQRRVDRAFAKLVDYLVERHTAQVVLIPMYHAQGDLAVCRNIHRLCTRKDHVRVLDELLDSSALLKGVFGAMTMHLGVRLHSVILATSAAVPSGLVAYMHKGHEYMELAGMREYTLEERELSFDALQKLADRVWDAAPALRFHLAARQAALANRYSETNEVVRAMLKREPLRLNRRAGNSDS